jgi:hypothetical protein
MRFEEIDALLTEGDGDERQRVQLARDAVAFDPKFVLAWDALAISLQGLADWADGAKAEQLRAEGERAEAIAVAREIMESGPLTYDHAYPYMRLIFAAGHLDETVGLGEQLRALEPLAMFLSRDQQWNYVAARRYD